MPQLRCVLAPITALWLLFQVGIVALVLVAQPGDPVAAHATECTCGHGEGLMCPMHHHAPAGEPGQCSMQAVDHSGSAVLPVLAGIAGFISQQPHSIQPPICVERRQAANARPAGQRPVPPDPPPPRPSAFR